MNKPQTSRNRISLGEIWVIVGIAAILMAVFIPFPRSRKSTASLTKSRNIGEAVAMYCEENDYAYPTAYPDGWWGPTGGNWALLIAPYLGHTSLVTARDPRSQNTWPDFLRHMDNVPNISFAANGLIKLTSQATETHGVMNVWDAWMHHSLVHDYDISHPASTVMVVETYGRNPYFGPSDVLTGVDWWDTSMGSGGLIPDGTRIDMPYLVNGQTISSSVRNGGINSIQPGKTTANFIWSDGHSKATVPTSTNPDPLRPTENLWDASRD